MVTVKYGGKDGKTVEFADSENFLVVRTRRRNPLGAARLSSRALSLTQRMERVVSFPGTGVEVLHRRDLDPGEARDARAALKEEPELRFAGRALCDPISGEPVVYTENLFVKLHDDVPASLGYEVFGKLKYDLELVRKLEFARNSFFFRAPEGSGRAVFDLALELLEMEEVEFAHPEVVRERSYKKAFPPQWHLQAATVDGNAVDAHANVVDAWPDSEGEGVVIAVIDDGVDMGHEEFASPHKIVSPRDVTRDRHNANPFFAGDEHGTACAGVACADGNFGASGVAPKARLLPIRLRSGLFSIDEAEAFYWAAKFGADVISCSWGPRDGRWWDPNDPQHNSVAILPDSTRLAIDAATDHGRNGRGCVITWAAGNGNESVDNDGYASYDRVIAVAACNDRGTKSVYSDFGDANWCAFPSSDFGDAGHPAPLTPGIWTTDLSGSFGYNFGDLNLGDAQGNYTNSFGGTSSACPGVAGVAALVLARNPALNWQEVKDLLRQSCDQIDQANGNYDAQGHSSWYGYGRLNAQRAVSLA